jgi:site-specific DNA-methyltransferase (adenine-specific)
MFSLFHGDCLEILKDISSNSVDCIVCDLPFGCLSTKRNNLGERDEETGLKKVINVPCAWDIQIDLEAFWREVRRIRKNDHTPTLHFCTTKYGFDLWESNKKEFRYDLVWDKGRGVSFLSANKMPMRSHEMIYVFSKAGAYYNRVDISGDFPKAVAKNPRKSIQGQILPNTLQDNTGKRCVKSVLDCDGYLTRKKGQHPTSKPVELYEFLLKRYCPAGGTVLDPTFGSCNSGRAARSLGLTYIGIEKDEGFFKKAKSDLLS